MVGLREANQKFSSLIKSVRSGKEVILTDHGKPVVRMVSISSSVQEVAEKDPGRLKSSRALRNGARGAHMAIADEMPEKPVETEEETIRRLEESGVLRRAEVRRPMPPFKGFRIRGKSIVDTIREMRDED